MLSSLDCVYTPLDLAPLDLAPLDLAPLDLAPLDLAPLDLAPLDLAPLDLLSLDLEELDLLSELVEYEAEYLIGLDSPSTSVFSATEVKYEWKSEMYSPLLCSKCLSIKYSIYEW